MRACVIEGGEKSQEFDVLIGTKQGCMLAPMLFSIFFAIMLLVAFNDCNMGDGIRFQTDGDVFDIRRLQAKTKIYSTITGTYCMPTTVLWSLTHYRRFRNCLTDLSTPPSNSD